MLCYAMLCYGLDVLERENFLAARLCRASALHMRAPATSDVDIRTGGLQRQVGLQVGSCRAPFTTHMDCTRQMVPLVAVLPLVSASGELNSQQLNSAPPSSPSGGLLLSCSLHTAATCIEEAVVHVHGA